jgi:hypothetical protein
MKKVLLGLLVILVIIQFIHPKKNSSTPQAMLVNDIGKKYIVPESVQEILKTSCYDCHSNNTMYPWYSKIQPVDWWLANHVNEGKGEVNFSEFATYGIGRQYKKLEEIMEQVKEDEMPLSSYTLIHKNAILSPEKKKVLTTWAAALRDSIKANTPADSLVRKRPPAAK